MPNQTAIKSIGTAAAPSDEEIRLRAFQIWETNGRRAGRAHEDWEQARRELAERSLVRAR